MGPCGGVDEQRLEGRTMIALANVSAAVIARFSESSCQQPSRILKKACSFSASGVDLPSRPWLRMGDHSCQSPTCRGKCHGRDCRVSRHRNLCMQVTSLRPLEQRDRECRTLTSSSECIEALARGAEGMVAGAATLVAGHSSVASEPYSIDYSPRQGLTQPQV